VICGAFVFDGLCIFHWVASKIRGAGARGFGKHRQFNPIFTIREQASRDLSGWSLKPKPSLTQPSGGFFHSGVQMNYDAFTNDSIAMMYEAVRGALAADDALERQGQDTRFRVRETPEWKNMPLTLKLKCSSAG
jgi:hypothetical protein